MTKTRIPDPADAEPALPTLALAEKGSRYSMWELLLQLRVLLPYLARLLPLLDRGLRTAPDFTELNKGIASGIASIQTGNRDLEVQMRNQALQLERIEQQMASLRAFYENNIEENRRLFAAVQTLRQWILITAIVLGVMLGATAGMVAFLLIHT